MSLAKFYIFVELEYLQRADKMWRENAGEEKAYASQQSSLHMKNRFSLRKQ